MRPLLEEFSEDIVKKLSRRIEPSTSRPEGLPLSEVFPSDKVVQITEKIQKFFDDSEFTYEKFKGLLIWGPYGNRAEYSKTGVPTPAPLAGKDGKPVFLMGQEKLAGKFARYDSKQTDRENLYDEFIETFYIYLYYEAFTKIFSDQKKIEIILQRNKGNIDEAKREVEEKLRDVENPEGVEADLKENVKRFYNIFMESLSFSVVDSAKMAISPEERKNYFEDFVTQNVGLFENYPISMNINKSSINSAKDLVDAIFNTIIDENFPEDNRQIRSIKVLSDSLSYDQNIVDLDVEKLQPTLDNGLRQRGVGAGEILPNMEFGRSNLQPGIINSIIAILSDNDKLISDVGAGWARGTRWEPYVKLMCAVVCFTGVFENLGVSKAKNFSKSGVKPVRVDVGEADGGLYFINNRAFCNALIRRGKGSLIKDIDQMIKNFSKKVAPFETDDQRLIKFLFFDPPSNSITDEISSYDEKDKETMTEVLIMTGVMEKGGTLETTVELINRAFFRYPQNDAGNDLEQFITSSPLKNFSRVFRYAATNSADVDISQTRPSFFKNFSPNSVIDTVVKTGETIGTAFSNIWNDLTKSFTASQTGSSQTTPPPANQATQSTPPPANQTAETPSDGFSADGIVRRFNDAFAKQFGFVRMEITKDASDKTFYVIRDEQEYGQIVKTLRTTEEIKEYVFGLCITSGSMLYHAKVLFGNSPKDRKERYYEYFNALSWFLKAAEEKGKTPSATAGTAWPLVYRVTPFLIDFVKYSMRDFVNNIPTYLKGAGLLTQDRVDAIDKANNNTSGQLKPQGDVGKDGYEGYEVLVADLEDAIYEYFKRKKIGEDEGNTVSAKQPA